SPPYLKTPTAEQREQLTRLEAKLFRAEKEWQRLQPEITKAQAEWERTVAGGKAPTQRIEWTPTEHLLARPQFDGTPRFVDGQAAHVPGRVGTAADFDGKRYINAGNVGDFGFYDKFTLAAWVYPKGSRGGTILARMTDTARAD